MKHSKFYFNDIYLGTLYENGVFKYKIASSQAKDIDIESTVHILERIRQIGLTKDFNYDNYVSSYNNSYFKDGFKFKQTWSEQRCRKVFKHGAAALQGALGLCMGPPTSHPRRVINGTDGTPGEVPLHGRVVPPT